MTSEARDDGGGWSGKIELARLAGEAALTWVRVVLMIACVASIVTGMPEHLVHDLGMLIH